MLLSVSSCCVLLSIALGFAYWYYYYRKTGDDAPDGYANFYCNKDLQYCLRSNPKFASTPPTTSSTPSKWMKIYRSCDDCIGTYYYTFGSKALGDCILRLQISKTAEEIDSALEKLADSVDDSCKAVRRVARPNANCLFFTNADGDIDTLTIGNLYDTVKNSLVENTPLVAKKLWLEKYRSVMIPANVGMQDPFKVMFWLAIDQTVNKTKLYLSQMLEDNQACLKKVSMSPCDK